MEFPTKLRALVLAELALANRDDAKIEVVIDNLTDMLAAALVVAYRDDRRALDAASTALEGAIHRSAVNQLEMLRSLGVLDEDDPL